MTLYLLSPLAVTTIGRQGENNAAAVSTDVRAWKKAWPTGEGTLLFRSPDGESWPMAAALENGSLRAPVTAAETARPGVALIEAQWRVADAYGDQTVVKSSVFRARILPAIGSTELPAAQPLWTDRVLAAGQTALAAAQNAQQTAGRLAEAVSAQISRLQEAAERVVASFPEDYGVLTVQVAAERGQGALSVSRDVLPSGETLALTDFPTFLVRGWELDFTCRVGNFQQMDIGRGYQTEHGKWFMIGSKYVTVKTWAGGAETVNGRIEHGLTVDGSLSVHLRMNDSGLVTLQMTCAQGYWTHEFNYGFEDGRGCFFARPSQGISAVRLGAACGALRSPVWLFGDGYFGVNDRRVIGQLKNRGYFSGLMIDAFPGQNAQNAWAELHRALALGAPRYLIWALGLSGSAEAYAETLASLRAVCAQKGITPILLRVPVLSAYVERHTAINEAVLASGLRYVDGYAAVRADGQGNWYAPFLSADGMNPTEAGARALAARFLADAPEIALCRGEAADLSPVSRQLEAVVANQQALSAAAGQAVQRAEGDVVCLADAAEAAVSALTVQWTPEDGAPVSAVTVRRTGRNLADTATILTPHDTQRVASLTSLAQLRSLLDAGQMVFRNLHMEDGSLAQGDSVNQVYLLMPVKPGATYHVHRFRKGAVYFLDEGLRSVGTAASDTFTVPADPTVTRALIYIHNFGQSAAQNPWTIDEALDNLQVEVGEAFSGYAPYQGETVRIPLTDGEGALAVAGGGLDLLSGLLTVTHDENGDVLETPLTYPQAQAALSTLAGDNVLWADAGAVSLAYRADVGLSLTRLKEALAALSGGQA